MRLVPTPIGPLPRLPAERTGGIDRRLFEAIVPAPGVSHLLDRLGEPGALAVTTGQQPGLFTGPLYTIHKALSAAALARLLQEVWGRPVVPVFWLANDDHDIVEAATAAWIAADGVLRRAVLRERQADAPLTPMYREPLGPEIAPIVDQLEGDLAAGPDRDAVAGWLRRHYKPDATIASSYSAALAELLAPHGIVCLDASHRAVKQLAAPLLLRAIHDSEALDAALRPLSESLAARGADPGVALGDGATLVLLEGKAGRDRLLRDGNGFITRRGHERFTAAALSALAASDPERLSPNVLLRPVVESQLLPTVAYLAGPGELRYLALTPPLYERLDVPRQEPVARWSGVLVEPRVDRVLDKFDLTLEELLSAPGAAEANVIREALPPELARALERLRQDIEREYGIILDGAVAIDPTLERPVVGARHGALTGLGEVERRLLQHLKRRREVELQQLARARTAVLPEGKPQERVLTIAPFLARYGRGVLDDIFASAHRWYARALEGCATGS